MAAGPLGVTIRGSHSPMKGLGRFVGIGLCFAAPGEFANQVLVHRSIMNFGVVMANCVVLLAMGYWISRGLLARLTNKLANRLAHYVLFGFLGLMIEWFLIGNSPWQSGANQPGMFTWWGTLFLMPLLVAEGSRYADLRRAIVRYFVVFSAVYLLVFALPNRDVAVYLGSLLLGYGTIVLNYWYVRYFRRIFWETT